MHQKPLFKPEDGFSLLNLFLINHSTEHETIRHPPEGRTIFASQLRCHPIGWAPKCLVLKAYLPGGQRKYLNAVVTGDRKADFIAIKRLLGGTRLTMASPEQVTQMTGCSPGTVSPVSFHPELQLIIDEALTRQPRLVFNAGRLDESISIATEAYLKAVQPRVYHIAAVG